MSEEEAVDLLATRFGVLLMHGSAFGAPQHLRLSYGSISPERVLDPATIDKLRRGFAHIAQLAEQRRDTADEYKTSEVM